MYLYCVVSFFCLSLLIAQTPNTSPSTGDSFFQQRKLIANGKFVQHSSKATEKTGISKVNQYYGKLVKPTVAADGNNVLIAWEVHNEKGVNRDISFTNAIACVLSRDDATSFSPQYIFFEPKSLYKTPSVFLKKGWAYLFWETSDNRFLYSIAEPGSFTFSKPKSIINSDTIISNPKVIVDEQNNIYVVYQEVSPDGFFISLLQGNLSTRSKWGKKTISKNPTALSPDICVMVDEIDQIGVQVVWVEKVNGFFQIFSKKLKLNEEINKTISVSSSSFNYYSPKCAYDNHTLYVVAKNDSQKNLGLSFFSIGRDNAHIDNLLESMLDCYSPSIKIIDNNLYVFWTDNTYSTDDIYLARRHLSETHFQPRKRLTWGEKSSINPDVFDNNKKLHVTWEEENEGSTKIFYMQSDSHVSAPTVVLNQKYTEYRGGKIRRTYRFSWEPVYDPSGIQGYSCILDEFDDTVPRLINLPAEKTEFEIDDIPNGNWFFHVTAIDKVGNYSKTVSMRLVVSNVNVTKQEETPRLYNISVESKSQLQNLKNFSPLGKQLVQQAIESTEEPVLIEKESKTIPRYYLVKRGDTLWNITVQIYKLPPNDIAAIKAKMEYLSKLNKIKDNNYIMSGSLLKLME